MLFMTQKKNKYSLNWRNIVCLCYATAVIFHILGYANEINEYTYYIDNLFTYPSLFAQWSDFGFSLFDIVPLILLICTRVETVYFIYYILYSMYLTGVIAYNTIFSKKRYNNYKGIV